MHISGVDMWLYGPTVGLILGVLIDAREAALRNSEGCRKQDERPRPLFLFLIMISEANPKISCLRATICLLGICYYGHIWANLQETPMDFLEF